MAVWWCFLDADLAMEGRRRLEKMIYSFGTVPSADVLSSKSMIMISFLVYYDYVEYHRVLKPRDNYIMFLEYCIFLL